MHELIKARKIFLSAGVYDVLSAQLAEYHELEFLSVGCMLTGIFAAAQALVQAYSHLLNYGSSQGIKQRLTSFSEFTERLGLSEKPARDESFRPGGG